ncbi:MAG: efflux RND transporter permease subunit [Candidatus Pacebacteria bacterium]|jgi:multidrug efflux pump subunit AcrB|nr:efflux RND transporter permease subunit [Candidatus Paceibacterota bacterium]
MWEFFVKNSRFGYLFVFALVAAGTYAIVTIPRESSPEVVIPIGVIQTILPGAPAADVESLVTNELERGLTSLENVKSITSTSREGVSVVTVEFDASADIDASIQDLKDEVDTLTRELPESAEDPFVTEVNFVDQPILTFSIAGDLLPTEFRTLADDLEEELELLPSISRVSVSGIENREIAVIVDQAALERYSISLSQVTDALSLANRAFPIGQITNDGITYNVAFEGDIADSEEIANVPITSLGGQPVFVRDVATIRDDLAAARTLSRVSVGNEPSQSAISFDVYKQRGGDITAITASVRERLTELTADGELLEGLSYSVVLDSGDQINKDLVNLTSSGLQTIILVVGLLALAIGWRESLIAGLAIPLSFLIGFIGLYLSGNTINFLSLFALILGIGILVDSAIVMVEGINAKMKANPTIDKDQAAIETIHEFAAPLISGTLTTVSMFVGLFIVSGVIGQFISSIPFTLIFILFASLFVALSIVPLFAAQFLRRRNTSAFEEKQVAYAYRLEEWYRGIVTRVLDNQELQWKFLSGISAALVGSFALVYSLWTAILLVPAVYFASMYLYRLYVRKSWRTWIKAILRPLALIAVIAVVGGITALTVPAMSAIKVVFFEQGDVDYVIVEVERLEGTEKEVTDITVRRVEEVLYQTENIDSFVVTVGSGSQFGSGGSGEKLANIFITLSEDREKTSTEVVEELRGSLAFIKDAKVTINQPSDGPPTGAAITIKYLGDDLVALTETANKTVELLKTIPHTTNITTSTNNNSTEFVLELDRAKAAALGLNPLTVSSLARTAVYGTEATTLTTLTEDIPVVVKMNLSGFEDVTTATNNEATIDALGRITIPTATGGSVPLSSVVTIGLRESSSVINHEDSLRIVTVEADVTAEGNAREVQAEALARIESELDLPDGVTLSTGGGETEESNQAFVEMLLALVVGLILMIAVLVFEFGSYLHTKYVLSILPYSLIGIFFGLAITANPISFPSIMGFIALSGIVVNNSILLIDMMNQQRRRNPERAIRDIVIDASVNRLRPILLTTLTTVIGMIPLTFAGDLWAPLAYAVMFGLSFSVIITLVLIPIIYNRKPGDIHHR